MKKGAGVFIKLSISLNRGSLNRVSGVLSTLPRININSSNTQDPGSLQFFLKLRNVLVH